MTWSKGIDLMLILRQADKDCDRKTVNFNRKDSNWRVSLVRSIDLALILQDW